MIKTNLIIALIAAFQCVEVNMVVAQTSKHGKIEVHPNKRFLQYADGTPFFYLGDTAWELFHRLDRSEIRMYMQDRAMKGFTVIQAVCLAELDGLRAPNAYGELPFKDDKFTVPNEKYFEHVDFAIDLADSLGLVIGLLPTWGDKIAQEWGVGPVIFTDEYSAETYGRYIGSRYKDRKNIIWILGGDRWLGGKEHIVRAMAKGVAIGITGKEDYTKFLMTYHPWGKGSSAELFPDEVWMHFNMQQNGHAYDYNVWEVVTRDYNKLPIKPIIDGEPLYDEHPIDFDREKNGTSNDLHVRRGFYHAVFSGAFGHTYGCHAIWQFWNSDREPVNGPIRSWRESLGLIGSYQVGYGKELMESRPFFNRIPDQGIVIDAYDNHNRITATRDNDGSYAMVYSESGKPFEVDLLKLSGKTITAWWYDVRSGRAYKIGDFPKTGTQGFHPPTNGIGNDWVLVLDDVEAKFPPPGTGKQFDN
ncbi:glycoside hydrolase family 140 protein [Olivibacter sitiensis]|uniref:glycoside hydrolase family 140 protein n=1 Tax=Olivibacter sitiensis TaxID=376470 RepID=UPI00040A5509|nr:glycoside hydrolase family 140 protein [Olivibacter sitiensis]